MGQSKAASTLQALCPPLLHLSRPSVLLRPRFSSPLSVLCFPQVSPNPPSTGQSAFAPQPGSSPSPRARCCWNQRASCLVGLMGFANGEVPAGVQRVCGQEGEASIVDSIRPCQLLRVRSSTPTLSGLLSPMPLQVYGWSWLPVPPAPKYAPPLLVSGVQCCTYGRTYPFEGVFPSSLVLSPFFGPFPVLVFSLLPLPGLIPAGKGPVAPWGLESPASMVRPFSHLEDSEIQL